MRRTPKTMLHPTDARRLQSGEREPITAVSVSFISWTRLVDELKASREIRRDEEVEAFVITDEGLRFYVRRR